MLFQAGHKGRWTSTYYYGGRSFVQLGIVLATLISGATYGMLYQVSMISMIRNIKEVVFSWLQFRATDQVTCILLLS